MLLINLYNNITNPLMLLNNIIILTFLYICHADIHICDETNTCLSPINCTNNEECTITCASSQACQNKIINCPTNQACNVHCINHLAQQQCYQLTIKAQNSLSLFVNVTMGNSSRFNNISPSTMQYANIYCPSNGPFTSNSPIACNINCDGDDLLRFTKIYAVEGFHDVSIQAIHYVKSWCYRAGLIHCKQDYSSSCSIVTDANALPFTCSDTSNDVTCNNYNATLVPTLHPIQPSTNPSFHPTNYPTYQPINPTITPSIFPSQFPSQSPSMFPSQTPSIIPTVNPSDSSPTSTPITSITPSTPSPISEGIIPESTNIFSTYFHEKQLFDNSAGANVNDVMIGVIVASVTVLCCIICVVIILCNRKKKQRTSYETDNGFGPSTQKQMNIEIKTVSNQQMNHNIYTNDIQNQSKYDVISHSEDDMDHIFTPDGVVRDKYLSSAQKKDLYYTQKGNDENNNNNNNKYKYNKYLSKAQWQEIMQKKNATKGESDSANSSASDGVLANKYLSKAQEKELQCTPNNDKNKRDNDSQNNDESTTSDDEIIGNMKTIGCIENDSIGNSDNINDDDDDDDMNDSAIEKKITIGEDVSSESEYDNESDNDKFVTMQ